MARISMLPYDSIAIWPARASCHRWTYGADIWYHHLQLLEVMVNQQLPRLAAAFAMTGINTAQVLPNTTFMSIIVSHAYVWRNAHRYVIDGDGSVI